jgi:hypothetical protein
VDGNYCRPRSSDASALTTGGEEEDDDGAVDDVVDGEWRCLVGSTETIVLVAIRFWNARPSSSH